MSKILVVDDDLYIRELICTLLRNEGFTPAQAENGVEGLERLQEDMDIALCIVDVMMPEMDGYTMCHHIRQDYDLPVLMLTAKGETHDKVEGFTRGADDYLTKPFAPEELIMRIRALLRRFQSAYAQTVTVGHIQIDRTSYQVICGGASQDIPRWEFELLFLLASFPGKTLTRDRLIEEVWGFDFDGNERTLDVHIGRLRERFPEERSGFKITTIRGLGYRLEVTAK